MSMLAATGLETIDYGMPNWNHIINANVDRIAEIRNLSDLLDVDVTDLAVGAVLQWDASLGKFVARVFS